LSLGGHVNLCQLVDPGPVTQPTYRPRNSFPSDTCLRS
jgi:hypothetical protein